MKTVHHEATKARRNAVQGRFDAETERVGAAIVDAAIKVHRTFGPGLLESVYEASLDRELAMRGFQVERQIEVPVVYEGADVGLGFRIDLRVDRRVIVEVKAVERLQPVHEAQVLTYLKLTGGRLAYLINFNVPLLRTGIKRMVL